MGKKLIALVVPAIEEKYDLFIPDFLTIEESAQLLVKAVTNLTQKSYICSGREVLLYYKKDKYMILNKKYTLADYGIENGDKLYIF